MKRLMTLKRIADENAVYLGSGGRSQENAGLGFAPAFFDYATCTVYRSRFADGSDAPFHSLDGLPDAVVTHRAPTGRVIAAKPTLVSGFVRNGFFYTRANAARAVEQWAGELDAVDGE